MPIAPPEQGHTETYRAYRVTITVGVIYFSLNARQVEVAIRPLDAVVLETSQVTKSARREGTQPTAFPASPHQPDRNYFITTYSFLIFMHGSPTALIVDFYSIAGGYPFSSHCEYFFYLANISRFHPLFFLAGLKLIIAL
jgi:hypothetical protein